jgi:hypothetical protein
MLRVVLLVVVIIAICGDALIQHGARVVRVMRGWGHKAKLFVLLMVVRRSQMLLNLSDLLTS